MVSFPFKFYYDNVFTRNAKHCISPYDIVMCVCVSVCVCVCVCRVCGPQENSLWYFFLTLWGALEVTSHRKQWSVAQTVCVSGSLVSMNSVLKLHPLVNTLQVIRQQKISNALTIIRTTSFHTSMADRCLLWCHTFVANPPPPLYSFKFYSQDGGHAQTILMVLNLIWRASFQPI